MQKTNIIVLGVAAGALTLGMTGGAIAGSLVTSQQIENNTVRSIDVKDGTLRMKDFRPAVRNKIREQAKDGANGTNGVNGTPGAAGTPGAPGSAAGVQTNWVAKDGAVIVNSHTIELTNAGTPAGASVEIENLNKPVQATKQLSFTYQLKGGAVYGGGSPRVFIEINGDFFNTHDGAPADAGTDNGNGTFTKTVTIPKNGRVGQAGIVMDSGVGSILISNVTIDGQVLSFS